MLLMIPSSPEPERGFVLAVLAQGADPGEELARPRSSRAPPWSGAGGAGRAASQRVRRPGTYVGKGKLEELRRCFEESNAESVLVDGELDPVQQRYLEDAPGARVIDRAQLILDIFAQHAVSAEGKLQVELAQLEYNLPRMRGMWRHLERLGGGVGTRGPGESQLETDRRIARRRVAVLRQRGSRPARSASVRRGARSAAARRRRRSPWRATRTSAIRRCSNALHRGERERREQALRDSPRTQFEVPRSTLPAHRHGRRCCPTSSSRRTPRRAGGAGAG